MRGTVLWISGWGMSGDVFASLQEELLEYTHLSVDFRDVGDLADMYRKIEKAVSTLSAREPIGVVGWSLGGMVAQRLAAERKISSLVLIGSTARFVRDKAEGGFGWPDAYVRQMQVALKRDREQVMHDFCCSMFTDQEQRYMDEYRELFDASIWTQEALYTGLSFLRKEDMRGSLPKINAPTTVIHGTADPICPYPAAVELADGIKDARLIAVEESGHVPFFTKKQQVIQLLKEVLPS